MRSVRNSSLVLSVAIVMLLSLLAAACAPLPPPPSEPIRDNGPEGETVCTFKYDAEVIEELVVQPGQKYISNHLVLTGPSPQEIGRILRLALDDVGRSRGIRLTCPTLAFPENEGGIVQLESFSAVMIVAHHTYREDPPPNDVAFQVVRAVNEISREMFQDSGGTEADIQLGRLVVADRNYVMTLDSGHIAEIDASPYEGSPGPHGGPQGNVPVAHFTDATQNWIWDDIEFPTSVDWTGEGVVVGVFDTYPPSCSATQCGDLAIAGLHDAYNVPDPSPDPTVRNIADHGAFVARLIKQTAPGSEIHMYRVLNEQGKGIVSSILQAVQDFQGMGANRRAMNMSLGIRWVPVGTTGTITEVQQLAWELHEADKSGTVVVAAAGNDALPELQLPAEKGFVMAVEASSAAGTLSCFSNTSNVAPTNTLVRAPGGGEAQTGEERASCTAPLECTTAGDHSSCVISLAPESSTTDYAYWSGTSFSTPLVTGLAALLLDADNSGGVNTGRIRELIRCGADKNSTVSGVISFTKTFDRAFCP
jgi:subtilisin family serine protease